MERRQERESLETIEDTWWVFPHHSDEHWQEHAYSLSLLNSELPFISASLLKAAEIFDLSNHLELISASALREAAAGCSLECGGGYATP